MRYILFSMLMAVPVMVKAQFYQKDQPFAHTYSIVAIDPETGDMGVAVQSNWFSVGTIVSWGEAGAGVIATQSFVNPAFGPDGLAMLQEGKSAQVVLDALIAADEGRAVRQLGVLDANGNAASYTGKDCIYAAGHKVGDGYAVQANLMEKETVWPAMAAAFEKSKGKPFSERLLLALEAAQAEGGDIRGKQSAALLVVAAKSTGKPWVDRKVDLRIDDHPEPLRELRRLLKVHTAYTFMNEGDVLVEAGKIEEAMEAYAAAEMLFPDNLEMQFWHAVTLANIGEMEEALPIFKNVFSKNKKWKVLTPRLTKNGLLTVSEEDLTSILTQ